MENKMEKLLYEFMQHRLYMNRTPMCDLFRDHKSDKSTWHNYTPFYNHIFNNMMNEELNLFEVGLGTNNTSFKSNMGVGGQPGASLRAFSKYFKNAKIYGADIDKDILFQEERIKTYYCDQTNAQIIKEMWDQIGDVEFDIIIDDGLHEADANIIFFKNSFQKLKKGGIYIIEDILNEDRYPVEKFLSTVDCEFKTVMQIPMSIDWTVDNSVVHVYGNPLPKINVYDNILAVIVK